MDSHDRAGPTTITFGPERGLNSERVLAAGEMANQELSNLGCEIQTCLLDPETATEAPVLDALAETSFDCIMIGAGLRGLLQHNILFEKVIKAIHQKAPSAKLCFNTHPSNTAEAILRWI